MEDGVWNGVELADDGGCYDGCGGEGGIDDTGGELVGRG